MRAANLGLRFLLELGALAAVGYWGWETGDGLLGWVLAIGAIAAVIAVWALFVSPKHTVETLEAGLVRDRAGGVARGRCGALRGRPRGAWTSVRGAFHGERSTQLRMAVSTIPELESSDRFLVQQVFKPIANEYRISVPTPGSKDEGRPLLFVKQKKLKIRRTFAFARAKTTRAARLHDQGANGVRVPRSPRRARRRRQPDRPAREGVWPLLAPQSLARQGSDRNRAVRGARVELADRDRPQVRRPWARLVLAARVAAVQLHAEV